MAADGVIVPSTLNPKPVLQDDPPLPAGKTYRQVLEETILKPGRDVETWAWGAHPEMPEGPSRQAIVFLHLPKCASPVSLSHET